MPESKRPRSLTPRVLVEVVIAVVLGLAVTVGVAWAATLLVEPHRGVISSAKRTSGVMPGFPPANESLRVQRFDHAAATYVEAHRWRGTTVDPLDEGPETLVPWWADLTRSSSAFDDGQLGVLIRATDARGWPALALRSEIEYSMARPAPGAGKVLVTWGIGTDVQRRRWRVNGIPMTAVLPLRPIWPGFAVDVLVWGVAAWLVLRGTWLAYRRWRRTRTGCLGCGYPRGESDRCPECGRPYAARTGPADRLSA